MGDVKQAVLGHSGGLDASVILEWGCMHRV